MECPSVPGSITFGVHNICIDVMKIFTNKKKVKMQRSNQFEKLKILNDNADIQVRQLAPWNNQME